MTIKVLCTSPLILMSPVNSQIIRMFMRKGCAVYEPPKRITDYSSSVLTRPVIVDWEKVAEINWRSERNVGEKKQVLISEWLRGQKILPAHCPNCDMAYAPSALYCHICGKKRVQYR